MQLASELVHFIDIAVRMIVVRRAAAGAVQLGKARPAFIARVYVIAVAEFLDDVVLGYTAVYIPDLEFVISDKLMTRIQISCRRDREVLCPDAASDRRAHV